MKEYKAHNGKIRQSTLLILIIPLVLLLISLSGCRNKLSNEVKIGAILPLTGQGAVLGKSYQNSMDIGVEYVNTQNKKDLVKIIYEDSQANSSKAVTAAQKLIRIDKVDILILSNANVVDAVLPVAIENKIPVLAITSTPNITRKSDLVFRIWLSESEQIEKIAGYIKDQGFSRVGVLFINNDYGLQVKDIIDAKIHDRIVYQNFYSPDLSDFKNDIVKIKNNNVDAIYILGNPPDYISMIKTIRENNIQATVLGTSALTVAFVREQLGSLVEKNVIFSGPEIIANQQNYNPLSVYFTDQYKTKFGQDPDWYYGFCFDQIVFLSMALELRREANEISLLNSMKNVKTFDGVNGKIKMDDSGDAVSPVTLFKQSNKVLIPINK